MRYISQESVQHMTDLSQESRAVRILQIRKALKMSRRKFSQVFGIATGTLQHWETPADKSGLSEKGAERLVSMLKTADIEVSIEWLLYGTGTAPIFPDDKTDQQEADTPNIVISKEIFQKDQYFAYLKKIYDNPVEMVIEDHLMEPMLSTGDHVFGTIKYKADIRKLENKPCIAVTSTGKRLIRIIKASDIPGLFNLHFLNQKASSSNDVLKNVELISAALIIWIWKNPAR